MTFVIGCQSTTNTQSVTSSSASASSSAGPSRLVEVKEITPTYRIDLGDQRRLAGLADAIFVGTVKEKQDTIFRHANIAYTKFTVNIMLVLKGGASGAVTVEQQGGFDAKSNTRYIVKGDRPLATGGAYIFVAMHREKENTYNVINMYGDIPLTDAEASAATSENPPVAIVKMRDSIANQIPS
ncbi:hypothetical protein [Mycobacterium sp. NPDC050853]|uniref:hypothetical protein n=1 Tax=Mycobacterium sp. NPDC050853 TaxID=3155160 RepID=UPI0033ED83A6